MKVIAFEGVDFTGKSTQVSLLRDYLVRKGLDVKVESFPRYDSPIGKMILDRLISGKGSKETLSLLFELDRYLFEEENHYCDVLLLDRYNLSNLAYGTASGVDMEWLRTIQLYQLQPDLNIILYAPLEDLVDRRYLPRDKFEADTEFLERVNRNYYDLAVRYSDNSVIIQANKTVPEIHDQIKSIVEGLLFTH